MSQNQIISNNSMQPVLDGNKLVLDKQLCETCADQRSIIGIPPNKEKLIVSADEAAALIGYDNTGQFRRAVKNGIFPEPIDPHSRPARWSRWQIEDVLRPRCDNNRIDPDVSKIERALEMK